METQELTQPARKVQEILRKGIDDMLADGASAERALGVVAARYGLDPEWTRSMICGSKRTVAADIIEKLCQTDNLDVDVFFRP